jgi:adenosylmethionine-8-amino-7-oxononanoate aminotransferase
VAAGAGLYCRADDRGDPVVQLAPPLVCDRSHFDEMEQILRMSSPRRGRGSSQLRGLVTSAGTIP